MLLIYFSPVRWESYEQRPHYMVKYFLEMGVDRIIWVNPYPTRLLKIADFSRSINGSGHQDAALEKRIHVLNVKALPIEPLPGGSLANKRLFWKKWKRSLLEAVGGERYILGIGKPSALALYCLGDSGAQWSFYDAMDVFPEFYTGWSKRMMKENELGISERVDTVIATTDYLRRKFSQVNKNIIKIENACNMQALPLPKASLDDSHESLTIGYIGAVADWFDWSIVVQLALGLPSARVVLYGPVFNKYRGRLPGNIELRGAVEHGKVGECMREFDVGLIPFQLNSLTEGVDPIKYYEYRAMGLPVIATRFGQMAFRDSAEGVVHMDKTSNPVNIISSAAGVKADRSEICRFRIENDWAHRFRALNGLYVDACKAGEY